MPDTYYFERGDTRLRFCRAWRRRRRRWSTRSGSARARSADQVAGRTGDAGLDRREGDGQGGRAAAGRRRLRQSAGKAHAARIRPDDRLRPGLRQGHARPLHHAGPSSIRRRPTTPISSTACRRGRSAIPARRRWKRSPNPRGPRSLRRRRNRRPRVRRNAGSASEERRALAPDREGRQGQDHLSPERRADRPTCAASRTWGRAATAGSIPPRRRPIRAPSGRSARHRQPRPRPLRCGARGQAREGRQFAERKLAALVGAGGKLSPEKLGGGNRSAGGDGGQRPLAGLGRRRAGVGRTRTGLLGAVVGRRVCRPEGARAARYGNGDLASASVVAAPAEGAAQGPPALAPSTPPRGRSSTPCATGPAI